MKTISHLPDWASKKSEDNSSALTVYRVYRPTRACPVSANRKSPRWKAKISRSDNFNFDWLKALSLSAISQSKTMYHRGNSCVSEKTRESPCVKNGEAVSLLQFRFQNPLPSCPRSRKSRKLITKKATHWSFLGVVIDHWRIKHRLWPIVCAGKRSFHRSAVSTIFKILTFF